MTWICVIWLVLGAVWVLSGVGGLIKISAAEAMADQMAAQVGRAPPEEWSAGLARFKGYAFAIAAIGLAGVVTSLWLFRKLDGRARKGLALTNWAAVVVLLAFGAQWGWQWYDIATTSQFGGSYRTSMTWPEARGMILGLLGVALTAAPFVYMARRLGRRDVFEAIAAEARRRGQGGAAL